MKELQELRRHLEVGLKHAPSVPMMQRLKVYRKLAEAAIELAVMCERLIEDVVLPNRSEAISKDKEPLI